MINSTAETIYAGCHEGGNEIRCPLQTCAQLTCNLRIPVERPGQGGLGLPDDIWLQIFSYFSVKERASLARVCREWNILCRDSRFWGAVDFRSCHVSGEITDKIVESVVAYSCKIRIIDFSSKRCHAVTDTSLTHVANHCPGLQRLNLTGKSLITNRGLGAIARSCGDLEQLFLSGCSRVSDRGVRTLASKCPKLEKLSLSNCLRLTDKSLSAISRKCSSLKTLDLSGCVKITDRGIKALSRYSEHLTDINLKDTTGISIEGIELLARGAPQLTRIQLGIVQDSAQTVAALNIIVKHCSNLQYLSFQHYRTQSTQVLGSRKFVSKKRLGAFVSGLSACGFML
ncbi:F-box/LRR-repeat protein 20 isoform X2 [Nematostella vectensis]|uniref:F-box/LRR-repeat protein 20 isoform X2 n=1 Tax=Nematostella vectensis TaxID=45351 RepID=UPI00207748AE|nr:F-box/LRR-repeat protein 20 isoform X2 [Nematostella vectensis]